MDIKLAGGAVQYHGEDLLQYLTDEHGEAPSSNITAYLKRSHPREPEIKDHQFRKNLLGFIARKSDLLFKPFSEEEKKCHKETLFIDDSFAIMPPMEVFMGLPLYLRREHFWKSLNVNDCVTGVVSAVVDQGLRLTLLCIDRGVCRDIDDLNIPAFCPVKELPKLYAKESALDAFQKRDIVRGIVLSVFEETERIIISLKSEAVPDENAYPRIGLITEDDFPVHYRRKSQIQDMTHEDMLQSILGFNNMGNVESLMQELGISNNSSYFRFFSRLKIPEKEYAEGLKKWQSQKLAHHSVVQGVEMFKKGEYIEAMQHLNRALQIDVENVEALVARGALYANKENFPGAVKDFEQALLINPKHNNARNYLIETLLTAGKMHEDRRELSQALTKYERVLEVEPEHSEATELIKGCRHLMAFQIDPVGSKNDASPEKTIKVSNSESDGKTDETSPQKRKKRNSSSLLKSSTDKLKALIKEDKERKPRSSKKDKRRRSVSSSSSRERNTSRSGKKKKQKREKKAKKKKGRASRSLSSDSESDSSTGRSRSRSSSVEKSHKKKKLKDKKSRKSKKKRNSSGASKREDRLPSGSPTRIVDKKKETNALKLNEQMHKRGESERVKTLEEDRSAQPPPLPTFLQQTSDEIKEGEMFSKSAAPSFMSLSSFNFFNRSMAIPGLGSPSPPREQTSSKRNADSSDRWQGEEKEQRLRQNQWSSPDVMSDTKRGVQDNRSRRDSEDELLINRGQIKDSGRGDGVINNSRRGEAFYDREGSFWMPTNKQVRESDPIGNQLRRDEALMADRKKFYLENKEDTGAYTRFGKTEDRKKGSKMSWSRSPSRSRSRSNSRDGLSKSGKESRKINQRRSDNGDRSRSKSTSPNHSRTASGSTTKDSGRKFSNQPATASKELDHYLGGARHLIQRAINEIKTSDKTNAPKKKEHSDSHSRSPSPWRSSKARNLKSTSPSTPSKRQDYHSISRSPNRQNIQPKTHGRLQETRQIHSRNPSPNRSMSSLSPNQSKAHNDKYSSPSSRKRGKDIPPLMSLSIKPTTQSQVRSRWDRSEQSNSKSPIPRRHLSPEHKEKAKDWEIRDDDIQTSFGRFGPKTNRDENVEDRRKLETMTEAVRDKSYNKDDSDCVSKNAAGKIKETVELKSGTPSFMPRILRKPLMDDPKLNKPLISSNQLEKEKKMIEVEKATSKDFDGNSEKSRKGDVKKHSRDKLDESVPSKDKSSKVRDQSANSREKKGDGRKHDGWVELNSTRDLDKGSSNLEELNNSKNVSKSVGEVEHKSNVRINDLLNSSSVVVGAKSEDEAKKMLQDEMEKEIERRVRERLKEQEKEEGKQRRIDKRDGHERKRRYSDRDSDDEQRKRLDRDGGDERRKRNDRDSDDERRKRNDRNSDDERRKRNDRDSDDERRKRRDRDGGDERRKRNDRDSDDERRKRNDRDSDDERRKRRDRDGGDERRKRSDSDDERRKRNDRDSDDERRKRLNRDSDDERRKRLDRDSDDERRKRSDRYRPSYHGDVRDRGREHIKFSEIVKGKYKIWDSRLCRYVSRSRSRSKSKSRSPKSDHRAKRDRSREKRRSRSRSNDGRPSERDLRTRRQTSRERRSRSGSETTKQQSSSSRSEQKAKPAISKDEVKPDESTHTIEKPDTQLSSQPELDRVPVKEVDEAGDKPDKVELEVLTKSRWDAAGKSRWDDGDEGAGAKRNGGKDKNSLTDLERFLLDLKQQKKKQWIAEGKVKEK